MLKKIGYIGIGIGILVYGYYLHLIMSFDESTVFFTLGGLLIGSSFNNVQIKKEVEVRYYSRVYRHYFSNDKKQIEEFDSMLKEQNMDLALACQYCDIKKDKF